ncbi:MAG: adenosylcobinamide-phosphate synthase CbiB [Acidimicrobiia bacterium]
MSRPRGRRATGTAAGLAVAAGLAADRLLGEPPTALHPVAWFGTTMGALERRVHAPTRRRGLLYCAAGVALGVGAGRSLDHLVGAPAATTIAVGVAVAGRMLEREARGIGAHLDAGDLPAARRALRALVGRDPSDLDEPAISRAVIESVAENTVDAVTAPVFWALVGGAPAVLAHRAINTMDAMVGHRNERYERFGWAAARLDDAAAWLPARLTTLLVLAHRDPLGRPRREVLACVRRQALAHPSPNGGLIEAAYAHHLGVLLGGTNRYGDRLEDRGVLGAGGAAAAGDIVRAGALLRRTTVELGAAAAVVPLTARVVAAAVSRARGRAR